MTRLRFPRALVSRRTIAIIAILRTIGTTTVSILHYQFVPLVTVVVLLDIFLRTVYFVVHILTRTHPSVNFVRRLDIVLIAVLFFTITAIFTGLYGECILAIYIILNGSGACTPSSSGLRPRWWRMSGS